MKTLEEWKQLLDQANERRMPLYVTPEELRELRELEAERARAEQFRPPLDWVQLLGIGGATEVVVDPFAVERRAGYAYQSLVQRLATLDPWISDGVHTCRFCGSMVPYTALLERMLSVSKSHTPECVWRLAQELVGFTAADPDPQARRYRP